MKPARAIQLAGGEQKALVALFCAGGYPVSKQSVSLWVKQGKIPNVRIFQLREIRPDWFHGDPMVKTNPKPRQPPANLQALKKPPKGKPSKLTPKPPFRPGVNGDPDTKI